jgi:hypothetical protein
MAAVGAAAMIRPTPVHPDRHGGRTSSASSRSTSRACDHIPREATSRPDHSNVITPRLMSRTPMAAAPMTAAERPLRAIQAVNRVTLTRVRSGEKT